MRSRAFSLVSVCLLLISFGCSDKPTDIEPGQLGESFSLLEGQSIAIPSENLTVTFERVVLDSRCPADPEAYCTWEGIAEIELQLAREGEEPLAVRATIPGLTSVSDTSRHQMMRVGRYSVVLRQLTPQPTVRQPRNEEYRAVIELDIIDGSEPVSYPQVRITDISPSSIHIAPFFLDTVTVTTDTISLDIGYGGGCQPHYFFLYMSPSAFMESHPVQANIYLRHVDNDDMCEAYIQESVAFDLRPMADLYWQEYGQYDPIVLNVHEYLGDGTGRVIQVTYEPQ
jgi:hypothetical protein